MTEPLVVDPSRLKAGGIMLQDLTFPAPPPSASFAGKDSVSAAINETLPVIESPVLSGMAAVKAAVERTGASIVAAARIYADADRTLGGHLGATDFSTAEHQQGRRAPQQLIQAANDQPESEPPGAPEPPLPDEPKPAQPGRIGDLARAISPVTQHAQTVMSTVQGAAGGMGNTSTPPAQDNDDKPTVDQSPVEETELADQGRESLAVPGDQASADRGFGVLTPQESERRRAVP